jgi:two-component system, NarL family, nitrate/nitrite response regulator NarL
VGERVRIVLADAHPVFLVGLARNVRDERPDLEVVASVGDGRVALRAIAEHRPHVAVIEHALPSVSGLHVLMAVTRDSLPTRVLFLAARSDGDAVHTALEAGAAGWLSKDAAHTRIAEAILAVHRGEIVVWPALYAGLADVIATRDGNDPPLTPRERQVLEHVARGATVNRVALELGMSRSTVKTHLAHLYDKFGVSSQAAAVAEGMRRGLIE